MPPQWVVKAKKLLQKLLQKVAKRLLRVAKKLLRVAKLLQKVAKLLQKVAKKLLLKVAKRSPLSELNLTHCKSRSRGVIRRRGFFRPPINRLFC
jgi:hypothetical protein